MCYQVNVKESSFTVGANPPDFDAIASFDLAGRMIGVYLREEQAGHVGESNYRRGYDNRVIKIVKDAALRNRLIETSSERQRNALYARCFEMVDEARASADLDERSRELLARAAARGPDALEADRKAFIEIYGSVPILPPDQYRALVLQVTRGCPFNECEFCTFYRGCEFKVNSRDEFEAHLDAVQAFFGESLLLRQSVFLGDANAVLVPTATLLERMEQVRARFEMAPPDLPANQEVRWRRSHRGGLAGFYGFLDGLTGTRKMLDDYRVLARAGLRRVYVGAESGCDEILERVKKPCRREQVVETVTLCKSAGVGVGVILLAGLCADEPAVAARHVAESCSLIKALPLDDKDIVYLSPYVDEAGATPALPEFIENQLVTMQQGLRFDGPRPKVVTYDIRGFIY